MKKPAARKRRQAWLKVRDGLAEEIPQGFHPARDAGMLPERFRNRRQSQDHEEEDDPSCNDDPRPIGLLLAGRHRATEVHRVHAMAVGSTDRHRFRKMVVHEGTPPLWVLI